MWRSVRQTAQAATRTRSWPGCTAGVGSSRNCNGLPGSSRSIARIRIYLTVQYDMQSEAVIFTIAKSRQAPTLKYRSQKSHLMSSPPTGDEGMHIIERKPQPRLLQSAVTNAELQSAPGPTDQGSGLSSARRIALIAGIVLVLILLAG